ncbi:MAG TPA: TIGR03435 family protein [Terriglobia bacterium]|nr:TIGR03435 family protein [Terriglobia bacterium]
MKRRKDNTDEFLLRHLGLFKTAPQQEMDLAEARIERRLRTVPALADDTATDTTSQRRQWRMKPVALAIGTIAAMILLVVSQLPETIDAAVVLASADGTLSRGTDKKPQAVRFGEQIEPGQILRTNGVAAAISLADGSRVELRPRTEFSVDRASDGVRIDLRRGSLLVHAAEQLRGHLYVQTRDVKVSVVGTVFFVNAEEEGSRVAVLEGEVRVQQGDTSKNLQSGEQLTTNPQLAPLPVQEELLTRHEPATLAPLAEQAAPPAQAPPATRPTFEVISIRPSVITAGAGGRGTPPGGAPNPPARAPARGENQPPPMTCAGPGSQPEVTPGRFAVRTTVFRLIVLAYGLKNCPLVLQMGLITGGPDWVKTDRFDIQATIPAGSPVYTRQQLGDGQATDLQLRIQALLADRFSLVVRRETKELPAFNLVVAEAGKLKRSADQTAPEPFQPGAPLSTGALPRGVMMNCTGNAILISNLSRCLEQQVGGTIVDKTQLKELFDIPAVLNVDPAVPMDRAFHASQVLDQVGLKLEPTKAPGEVLTIERVERPSEN